MPGIHANVFLFCISVAPLKAPDARGLLNEIDRPRETLTCLYFLSRPFIYFSGTRLRGYLSGLEKITKKPSTPNVDIMSARHPIKKNTMPHDDSTTPSDTWLQATARQLAPHLERYADSVSSSRELARDAVQDTFRKLAALPRKERPDPPKPWLFRVCRNRLIDLQRRERRSVPIEEATLETTPADIPTPQETSERSDLHSQVIRSIENLPAAQREVVRLKFQNELSYKEISEITQHSVSYIGVLLHSAMKTLRQHMAQYR